MTWLPRTLFQRNLLLIVALILVGQIGSAWLFRTFVTLPRTTLLAEGTVRELQALETGLGALPPAERSAFVAGFNGSVKRAVQRGEPPADTERWRATRLQRLFLNEVGERWALTGHTLQWRPLAEPDVGHVIQVRLDVQGQAYWVNLPGLPPAPVFSGAWLAATIATALLAILGAWLIQRRINRPLNDLVHASAALGRGERPSPLPVDGVPREIASVSHAFNDMAVSLAQSERERSLMLAGLSHDLRTPLAKMRLATEMLDGRAEAELLGTLNRNIDAMDSLLGRFLDFVRSSEEDRDAPAQADLNALVQDALTLCPADGVHWQPGPLSARPLRRQGVMRMVLNLVVNAQRYGAPPIEVATGEDGTALWLEVRDRGPGIQPSLAESLKQPFKRGDAARSGPSGAGLGLAIVERVAQAHGAQFQLLPRPGGGLVARVAWPG
ncbi:ATP-binding protein [Ideonella sp. DXS29W]|uniref:histidine kinase n=1 Tax=Ideonella lacteola TaxID=2984193 RepID=A0ABU9BSK1_9BURK